MRIALLGSVTSPIPPEGQAAIERLVYQQALGLASKGHQVLLFTIAGSHVPHQSVTIVEVGKKAMLSGAGREGAVAEVEQYGAAYKLRLEIVNLARVLEELINRKDQYDVILNNLRGEAVLVPIAHMLGKPLYHVVHLPIFPELAQLFEQYKTHIIAISGIV